MIYFDNAATSYHKPESVARAVADSLVSLGNASRGAHGPALNAARLVYDTRVKVASLFGVSGPNQVIFTGNTTQSLNMVINGLLKPGDHVITSLSEHNSVLRPLYRMEEKGVKLSLLPMLNSGDDNDAKGLVDISALDELLTSDTRAVILSHASNVTGNVTDIKEVSSIIRSHKDVNRDILLIVDAAQTAGSIQIDVDDMGIDILAFTGHKSMLGPQGTGGIVLGDRIYRSLNAQPTGSDVIEGLTIEPLIVGGTGFNSFDKKQPDILPEALEAGTLNGHGIAGLNAAIDYINSVGIDNIQKKERELTDRFIEGISRIIQTDAMGVEPIRIYGDTQADVHAPIVTLNIGDMDASVVTDILWEEYEIAVRSGAHCAPLIHEYFGTAKQGAVRFSFSYFNTEEEVDTAIKAIEEIASGR